MFFGVLSLNIHSYGAVLTGVIVGMLDVVELADDEGLGTACAPRELVLEAAPVVVTLAIGDVPLKAVKELATSVAEELVALLVTSGSKTSTPRL